MPAQAQTVTEKRISIQVQLLDTRLSSIYTEVYPDGSAPEAFFRADSALDSELGESLAKRPLGLQEIKRACKKYARLFREAALECRQRAGTTDPKGGEVAT